MFGHTARHVITTRKETPLEGAHSEPQENTTDGWYIDLDQRISCDPYYPHSEGTRAVAFLRAVRSSGPQVIDKPEIITVGKPETGFSLQAIVSSMRRINPLTEM